jgi:hypothetical protein
MFEAGLRAGTFSNFSCHGAVFIVSTGAATTLHAMQLQRASK